jgi:diadenosine tetraphosphate (Ap4A) HIT family hydrolase
VSQEKHCPFCEITQASSPPRVISQNEHAFVIRDGYPVTPGHSLIIPKRHVGSYFEASESEKQCLLALLDLAKLQLDGEFKPAAYNIGINDGAAAGQTVPHCHIHLIPRYDQDSPYGAGNKDPRGGVRWVVPEKADYWSNRS